ncbi:hypothetical protein HPP_3700 [Hydrangea phyllody phytoplasma]|uniref:Uncharacterized protein n=2 Tax=16SrI (Aster yellows group) TaxID=3042590 RepID=A0ABQ5PTH5_9MOLU|nr:hypothetical protein HPP_3700 [Hydrangea phyllody phytoplasma]GLH61326.1 hypothetical protein RHYP_2720 [Rhus yellows phytoplasma]GLH61813.1 hypothetical protein HP2P_2200 [Hydrangea phyllody phytoplasma]
MFRIKFIIFKPELDKQGRKQVDNWKTQIRNIFNFLFFLVILLSSGFISFHIDSILKQNTTLHPLMKNFLIMVKLFFWICALLSLPFVFCSFFDGCR